MIKWILGFIAGVLVAGLVLDASAQVIVVNPDGSIKETIILPLPPPIWR
jgi:ribose 5-phosphate isomerase